MMEDLQTKKAANSLAAFLAFVCLLLHKLILKP